MSWETLAKIARGDRPRTVPKESIDSPPFVIPRSGFCNPNAIANERFREERLVEKQMRGGWSEAEAKQMLRDKGQID